jgi:hypothetical protein
MRVGPACGASRAASAAGLLVIGLTLSPALLQAQPRWVQQAPTADLPTWTAPIGQRAPSGDSQQQDQTAPDGPVWQAPAPPPLPGPVAAPTDPVIDPVVPAEPSGPPQQPPAAGRPDGAVPIAVSGEIDPAGESAQLLVLDRTLSDLIFDNGPIAGYSAVMSPEGALYDAGGASPPGVAGVEARFATFPPDVKLERRPERALADAGAGSTWGTFAVRRGQQVMTEGYYFSSWRREDGVWRLVGELAAGRAPAQPALPPRPPTPEARRQGVAPGAQPETGPTGGPVLRDAFGRPVPASPPPSGNR